MLKIKTSRTHNLTLTKFQEINLILIILVIFLDLFINRLIVNSIFVSNLIMYLSYSVNHMFRISFFLLTIIKK